MQVGTLLKQDLGKAEMRPIQLAKKSKVPRQKISEYLNKGRNPSEDNLKKILSVLPRLTEKRKAEYWKAHREQMASTDARRKGVGVKQKAAAAVRRLSTWYDVEIEYDHLDVLKKNPTFIKNILDMDPETAYKELVELAESFKTEKRGIRQKGVGTIDLDVGCTITLMPKPTNSFPALRWKTKLSSGEKLAEKPSLETMVDGQIAHDGEKDFLYGTWSSDEKVAPQVLRLIAHEAGTPYFGVYALALQKMQECIHLYESQQEQKIGRVSVPLNIVIEMWQSLDGITQGEGGAIYTMHFNLRRICTFWLRDVIEWKINKELASYFENMISLYSRSV